MDSLFAVLVEVDVEELLRLRRTYTSDKGLA